MAGYNQKAIRRIIRQARASVTQPDPCDAASKAWLTALVIAASAPILNGEQSLISSTINGKSISMNVPTGMTRTDAANAMETALEWLESGSAPVSEIRARF